MISLNTEIYGEENFLNRIFYYTIKLLFLICMVLKI